MTKLVQIFVASIGLLLMHSATADSPVAGAKQAINTAGDAESQHPNLTRDNETQVVTDSSTQLEWEDSGKDPIKATWPKANEHCSDLNFAGQQDWRLPTTEELAALAIATKIPFSSKRILKRLHSFDKVHWTSDTIDDTAVGGAYTVEFSRFDNGKVGNGEQNIDYSVRCVRNST